MVRRIFGWLLVPAFALGLAACDQTGQQQGGMEPGGTGAGQGAQQQEQQPPIDQQQ